METTGAEACARIVERDDPHLHATALFAPEPARSRLVVLYAFDIELSRAAQISSESLIPRMRLQWWRETIAAAQAGEARPAHEVAGPLARLIAKGTLPAEPLDCLIAAREAELAGRFDAARFSNWADDRFGTLTALAAHLLTGGAAETVALARRAGPVLGAAYALRNSAAMAAEGRFLLPGLSPGARAALARGELAAEAREVVSRVAGEARDVLASIRAERFRVQRAATPAFLPLARAGRVLRHAERLPRADVEEGLATRASRGPNPGAPARSPGRAAIALGRIGVDRPFDGMRLVLRAATGRW